MHYYVKNNLKVIHKLHKAVGRQVVRVFGSVLNISGL